MQSSLPPSSGAGAPAPGSGLLSDLLDDGVHGTGRQVHHDDVAVRERVPATGVRLAVDGNIAALDRDTGLGAVLDEAGELEELAEPDPSAHG